MKKLLVTKKDEVYNAPTIPWNNGTYTPISNKFIIDMIRDKINNLGLVLKNENYKAYTNEKGLVRGTIGSFDVVTDDNDFGQRVMFRNSYDKSMSFAFVCGMVVWICENGCIKGDYQYRRIHRGVITETSSTTQEDIILNINDGFKSLQASFEKTSFQMNEMKHLEISPNESYNILGELFFQKEILSITQLSSIKKELLYSKNFRHLRDTQFTAYDLYNHVTEVLKTSHPLTYIHDHVETHKLFEQTFNI